MTIINRTRASPIAQTLAKGGSGTLLMVGPLEETARRIESFLRNAGHPVRCGWSNDLGELEDLLQRDPPDLILCDVNAPATPPSHIIHMAAELTPDMPVLVVAGSVNAQEAVAALSLGAKDLVSAEDARHLRHLELVVVREFLNHHNLRNHRLTRERLEDYALRHERLVTSTADAVARVQEGIVSMANKAFISLLGRDDAEGLIGTPLIDLVAVEQRSRVKERLRQVARGKYNGEPLEFSLLSRDFPLKISAQLILSYDQGERVIEMLIRSESQQGMDFTQTMVVSPTLPHNNRSNVLGRSAFLQVLNTAAEPSVVRGGMFFVVDGFAGLEDRVGLVDAEEVTRQAIEDMQAQLQAQDAVFAFSPGEIAAFVTRASVAEIESIATSLRVALSTKVYVTSHHEAQITLSACVYPLAPNDRADNVLQELVREARRISQKAGNELAVLGSAAKSSHNEREDARKAALVRKALETNQLRLAYQSIASLEGDARPHFDVLLRMADENNTELHAAEFLPAAERFGLMRSIDRWVLARALSVIVKRSSGGETPSLFVRLSEDSIKDAEGFLRWISELLAQHPLKDQEFVFEMYEPTLQNHVRKAVMLSEGLHKLGAGIAVNHYGLTATSAQLLEHLPHVDFLKFHHSYTQKFNDKDVQRRMGTLMEIAKAKKLKTIVSHVEDANVMARLWQMGVNYIQGFHVQEPEVVMMGSEIRG